jgi:hypothetical protein
MPRITLWKNSFRTPVGAVIEVTGLQCTPGWRQRSEIVRSAREPGADSLNAPRKNKTSAAGEINSD